MKNQKIDRPLLLLVKEALICFKKKDAPVNLIWAKYFKYNVTLS
jgi:hypothetical protein